MKQFLIISLLVGFTLFLPVVQTTIDPVLLGPVAGPVAATPTPTPLPPVPPVAVRWESGMRLAAVALLPLALRRKSSREP